jgi:hypothetical protein
MDAARQDAASLPQVQVVQMAGTEKGVEVNQLVKYEAAKFALSECVRVDEVKDIRDKSAAIAAAARIAKDKQLEIDASEIRIRAERRLGEMIREQKQGDGLNEGGRPLKTGTHTEPVNSAPTLASVGISKKLSSRAQSLAAIPAEDFEVTLDEHRAQQQSVTVATMQKLAEKAKEHEQKEATEPEKKNKPIPAPIEAALNRLETEIKLCAGSGWKRCDKNELTRRIKSIMKKVEA